MNRTLIITCASAALTLLASCGGGSYDSMPVAASTPATPTPTPSGADAYTQSVQAVLALSSETAAPIATEGLAVFANDTGSPITVY